MAQERVLGIQRKLHKWAEDDQGRRFTDLHNLVCDPATLMVAWQRVRANRGSRSAGVDRQNAYDVEQRLGVEKFLGGLREELRAGSFWPVSVRERLIPKRGGKLRRLGIPTVTAYGVVVQRAFGFVGGDASVSPAGGGAPGGAVRAPLGGLAVVCLRGRAAGERDASRARHRSWAGAGGGAVDRAGVGRAGRAGGFDPRCAGCWAGSLMLCANLAQADERLGAQRVERRAVAYAPAAVGAGGWRSAGDVAREAPRPATHSRTFGRARRRWPNRPSAPMPTWSPTGRPRPQRTGTWAWPPPMGRDSQGPQTGQQLRGRTKPQILRFAPGSTTPTPHANATPSRCRRRNPLEFFIRNGEEVRGREVDRWA